jgi:fructokinase
MDVAATGAPSLVAWGEVLWDLFPDRRRLGGAPANVAYHLASLGGRVSLVTRVGDDAWGREAVAALAAVGVEVGAVQVDARPTGAVEVELVDGEPRYRMRDGCAWEHIDFDDAARARVAGARAICFGTLSVRLAEARDALGAALAARPAGCLAVCDLNLRPGDNDPDVVRWALGAADVVKINEREADVVAAMTGQRDVVGWLLGETAQVVALTRGAGGCRLVTRDGGVDQAGFLARAGGDNVGCGDAFTAVLMLGLVGRVGLAEIAAAACRHGAFVAGERGATPAVPPGGVRF